MRLIYLTVAWILGITASRHFPAIELQTWMIAGAAAIALALLCRRHPLRGLLLLAAAMAAGGTRMSPHPRTSPVAAFNGLSGTITGIVVEEPKVRDDRIQLRLAAESIFAESETAPISGHVLVESNRIANIQYGDRIRATGAIHTPATGDTFSYADYLGRQGIYSIMRYAAVDRLGSGYGDPIATKLQELKHIARRVIATNLPEPQAGLLTGIMLGDKSGISPQLAEDFSRVGASHVIAISGFNMIIVSAIVIRVIASLFSGNKLLVTVSAVSVIALYTLFIGASPGILRAALMSGLLVIGNQLNRRTFVPTSLALAALALSFVDPNTPLDVGFQLSFFAVLGLALFADPLSRRFRALLDRMMPPNSAAAVHGFLNEPLIVSIAAQIATMPLIVLYFGRLSLVALPVNLLIVPVQTAVLLLGMAAVMVYVFVPAVGMLLFWADLVCLSWTITVVRQFAAFDFAELIVHMDGRLIQFYYLCLIGGAMVHAARLSLWQRISFIIRRNSSAVIALSASALTLFLTLAMIISRPDGRLHVWLLDVGHSNAMLLATPGGAHILVDGGRFPARLLTALGDRLPFYDREIEILVITHPDAWDTAALNSVLDRYEIGAALYHGQENRDSVFQEILTRLQQSQENVVEAVSGHRLEFSDGVVVEVLHPAEKPSITDKLSDQVMVLRVSYGDVSFLLTSDLSVAGQREMLDNGVQPVASIMQIPQHGGVRALDDEFLARVQPQVVLLQSDVANRRDDPDPDTLAVLDGLDLFRTDEIGTIHLSTDGLTLRVFANS